MCLPLRKMNEGRPIVSRETDQPGQPTASGQLRPFGLYDPAFEHDSCGVGFIARLDAAPRHDVVADAVQVLVNLEHRGALGGDKATGDGAGLLLQMPDAFLREELAADGIALPDPGDYAVAMAFLPTNLICRDRCIAALGRVAEEAGCEVLGWRKVPIDTGPLGEFAAGHLPDIRQLVLGRGAIAREALERKLYVIRRVVENEVASWESDTSQFFIPSLSARKIVYKGMLVGTQLATFYPDLLDPRFAAAYAIVHQRYSTNTFPSWQLAQPFRMLAHNGEINTLRGNVTRMRAREAELASELFGEARSTRCGGT